MREILFRGKRVDNNEWIYGNLIYENVSDKYYIDLSVNIREDDYCKLYVYALEVIPETIGQYTGLNDKYGNKIFEGDIVKNNWNNIYGKDIGSIWEVKFGEYDNSDIEYGSGGNIGFYAYNLKNGDEEGLNNLPCNFNDGIEVIGNIYDGDNNE